jgi:hypothetical protein
VPERKDIQDALREAVDRTVRASMDTRDRAQGAAEGVAGSVRSAVEDRLPVTQDDMKALRAELARVDRRLQEIERRLDSSSKPS